MQTGSGMAGLIVLAAMLLGVGCEGGGSGGGSGGGNDFGDNNPDVISAVGDSITEGSGVAASYPSILAGMVGKTVHNRGSGGATARDGAARIGRVLQNDKPGYVLILYGANDVIHGLDHDGTIGALGSIIEACKANRSVPIIATLTPMQATHGIFGGSAQRLSQRIRDLAGQTGAALCDLESEFGSPSPYLQGDGLHPTDEGCVIMADAFASRL